MRKKYELYKCRTKIILFKYHNNEIRIRLIKTFKESIPSLYPNSLLYYVLFSTYINNSTVFTRNETEIEVIPFKSITFISSEVSPIQDIVWGKDF